MEKMGFLISHKNNEQRRALLPEDLECIRHRDHLVFETGYGDSIGFSDKDYHAAGASIGTREQVLACGILVDVKLGDADYLDQLQDNKLMIGWAHAVQKMDFTSSMLKGKHTVLAWEEIFEDGRYIFYRNREVAGEAAVLHAYRYCGKMPYDTKVAIIGNGQTAKGAMRILHGLGAQVDVYGRRLESLFKKNMYDYDVIVNCVMWDTSRGDHLICREDLRRMRPGTMLVDVACDPHMGIETSHETTIDDPVYTVDGVIHYAVDNTPAMFPITVTKVLSEGFAPYVDAILEEQLPESLRKALVLQNGEICDPRIRAFREARGIPCAY